MGFSGPATVIRTSSALSDVVGLSRFIAPYIKISEPSKFAVIATSSFESCATNSSACKLVENRYAHKMRINFLINGLYQYLMRKVHWVL